MAAIRAPFPYFGGKSAAAETVWNALGHVSNYVEPFAGSLAVLLSRPDEPGVETVNDADGLLCNVWRALRANPSAVAEHAEWPIHEIDLHARHLWLVGQRESLTNKLLADPEYFDAKAAGWWVWGACCWIGGGWCSGKVPWSIGEDGGPAHDPPPGMKRKPPEPAGVTRRRPHLGHGGHGIHKPSVSRQLPSVGEVGVNKPNSPLLEWFDALSARLRNVRVCCGDWKRVCTPSVTFKHLRVTAYNGTCGVFLDPPYSAAVRTKELYAEDSVDVSAEVRAWCLEHGDNPKMRVVLAGFSGEGHESLEANGWRSVEWFKSGFLAGGYANQSDGGTNQHRERLWLSPHCLGPRRQANLWGEAI